MESIDLIGGVCTVIVLAFSVAVDVMTDLGGFCEVTMNTELFLNKKCEEENNTSRFFARIS